MASRYSPSFAKNILSRSLRAIVDPHPQKSQIREVFEFFSGCCVYCGKSITLGSKEMHLDHLVSESHGGSNHISNRVPSCATCNEEEKRELDWGEFLSSKPAAKETLAMRRQRIEEWVRLFPANVARLPADLNREVHDEIEKVVVAFDIAMGNLRDSRDRRSRSSSRGVSNVENEPN